MKLKNAQITILAHTKHMGRKEAGVIIELYDADASTMFAEVTLTAEQWVEAMSRLSHTECSTKVFGLDKVGKKMTHKSFEFSLGNGITVYDNDVKALAKEEIKTACPPGWTPDTFFSSQGSFFTKDDETWARTTIRKWE